MENKKSEMSVEYNMDEMKKSLKNLKETECYDVEKYTYSLLHQTRQLEYFYCHLVKEQGRDSENTFYHLKLRPKIHQLAYFNIGRGFPKELMDGHWCYILKTVGCKSVIVPCTSIKDDNINSTYEFDIEVKMNNKRVRSRLQLSDIRTVDNQRLDIRKRLCTVLTDEKIIKEKVKKFLCI